MEADPIGWSELIMSRIHAQMKRNSTRCLTALATVALIAISCSNTQAQSGSRNVYRAPSTPVAVQPSMPQAGPVNAVGSVPMQMHSPVQPQAAYQAYQGAPSYSPSCSAPAVSHRYNQGCQTPIKYYSAPRRTLSRPTFYNGISGRVINAAQPLRYPVARPIASSFNRSYSSRYGGGCASGRCGY